MIMINGVAIPTPSAFNVGLEDIVDAERSANGTMLIQRIATKRKLEVSWNFLSRDEATTLLQAVSPVTFLVEYPDPQTGQMRTGRFYSGSKGAEALDFRNGIARWKGIKFNLIEV